jgi:plasmid stability protein
MARTTIDIDHSVLGDLRRRAEREHKSMGRVASELLAAALATTPDAPGPAFRWTSADLGVPRVDLENKEAVRRALDDG